MTRKNNKTNTNKFSLNFVAVFALLIVSGLLLAGCEGSTKVPVYNNQDSGAANAQTQVNFDPDVELNANKFATEEEYLAFIKARQSGGYDSYYGGVAMERLSSISATPTAAPSKSGSNGAGMSESADSEGSSSNSYSGTNNQVETVDEADIIKTDGNYIYTVSGNTLFIIKAYPGEDAEVVSEIKFETQPQGLFIDGKNLAVFGYSSDYSAFSELSWRPRSQLTFFNIYDTTDKEKPALTRELKFEGSYFEARLTEDFVYFVTVSNPEYRQDRPTPFLVDGTSIRSMPVDSIYYFPVPYDSVQLATVSSISLTNMEEEVESKSVAVQYGQTMYMNEENLFITYTETVNEWEIRNDITLDMIMPKLNDADLELIKKINAVDSDVLSNSEKKSKVMQLAYDYISYKTTEERQDFEDAVNEALQEKLDTYDYMEYTIINKMSLDIGQISVEANGKVPGHVMNQFSMDEKDEVLRIATTVNQRWNYYSKDPEKTMQESTNHIFTLDDDLNILDSKNNIAKGEQIYSTRFLGDKLYMVTFKQVDPFFVFDLSNPQDIEELGQLKIPGFSRYLHPYDENTLIGIGRDASSTGEQRGLKISLFDVSDFQNPKEIAKFVTGSQYTNSVAEYEHKAFLFDREKQLLVIPAYSYEYQTWARPMPVDIAADEKIAAPRTSGFNGAMVFNITKNKVELRGVVDHSQGQQYWGPSVERSLFINELLYTKSQGLLRINKLSDLSKVKNIELKGFESEYPVY